MFSVFRNKPVPKLFDKNWPRIDADDADLILIRVDPRKSTPENLEPEVVRSRDLLDHRELHLSFGFCMRSGGPADAALPVELAPRTGESSPPCLGGVPRLCEAGR